MFKDNHEFRMFAAKKGIVLLFSPPYTQKLNSVVERPIRTLCEMAVAMSRHANTPRRFMNFAMKFATKLLNRLFRRMPDGTDDVPLWRYKGSKVPLHLDRFHPFGCAVEAVLPPRLQTRFGPKTTSCIYMGYDDSALSYILATLPRFGFLHTAHAIFDDTGFPCRKIDSVWKDEASFDADISDPLAPWLGSGNLGEGQLSGYQPNIGVQNQEPGEAPAVVSSVPNVTARTRSVQMPARAVPTVQNPLRRSARGWQPSAAALQGIANSSAQTIEEVDALFEDHIVQQGTSYAFSMHEEGVPYSFKNIQTFSPLEREKWMAACREESASHLAIPSISGALAPEEWTKAAPIRLTWVFARKPTGDYKARIVMLGQHMQAGVHFNDTHAPVPAATIVRLLLAITAAEGREFTQLDVKTAFLTAPMDIELDVILPEGFGTGQDNHLYDFFSARRRRALTAIPGCPQGSRVWREKLVGDLGSLGFKTFLRRSHASSKMIKVVRTQYFWLSGWTIFSCFRRRGHMDVLASNLSFKVWNVCFRMV